MAVGFCFSKLGTTLSTLYNPTLNPEGKRLTYIKGEASWCQLAKTYCCISCVLRCSATFHISVISLWKQHGHPHRWPQDHNRENLQDNGSSPTTSLSGACKWVVGGRMFLREHFLGREKWSDSEKSSGVGCHCCHKTSSFQSCGKQPYVRLSQCRFFTSLTPGPLIPILVQLWR